MARNASSPERRAVNVHLHNFHNGAAGHGSTDSRKLFHDNLHNGTDPAGKPLHVHPEAGSLEYEEVVGEQA